MSSDLLSNGETKGDQPVSDYRGLAESGRLAALRRLLAHS